jgi:hypothetical protein
LTWLTNWTDPRTGNSPVSVTVRRSSPVSACANRIKGSRKRTARHRKAPGLKIKVLVQG